MLKYEQLSPEITEKIGSDRANNTLPQLAFDENKVLRRDNERDKATIIRPPFIRDIDKIMHCPFYNRYADKTQVLSFYKNDDIMMYSVTGSAVSIQDVVRVTVDENLQPYSPNISYKYRSMQDSEENDKEMAKDDKVLKTDDDDDGGGSYWLVTITLSLNGQNVKKWIRINVVSAQNI